MGSPSRAVVSPDPWYPSPHLLSILRVLVSEEVEEGVLLHVDPPSEEEEGDGSVGHEADGIQQNYLCPHRPEKPAHVGRVATPRIDSRGDKMVVFVFSSLDDMVEISSCVDHGEFPDGFPEQADK